MKRVYISALLLVFGSVLLFAGGNQEEEPAVVEGENRLVLADRWSVAWEFSEDQIEFTLTAPTTGWLAIGFNPSRMMKGADYIIGYVDGGEVSIRDDYGTGNTSHASDVSLGGSQDVRVISGSEEDGVTTLVFSLPLDSGDEYDAVFTPGEQYSVIFAYGPDGADDFTTRHRARESAEFTL